MQEISQNQCSCTGERLTVCLCENVTCFYNNQFYSPGPQLKLLIASCFTLNISQRWNKFRLIWEDSQSQILRFPKIQTLISACPKFDLHSCVYFWAFLRRYVDNMHEPQSVWWVSSISPGWELCQWRAGGYVSICLLSFCGGARPLEHLQESPKTSVDTFVCWRHCVNSHDRLEITYFSLPSDGLQRERVHTLSCETVQLAYRCSGEKNKSFHWSYKNNSVFLRQHGSTSLPNSRCLICCSLTEYCAF